MSKYEVNDQCIGCGMCVGLCTDVFEMGEDSYQAHAKDVDTEDPAAEEAQRSCPVGAIQKK